MPPNQWEESEHSSRSTVFQLSSDSDPKTILMVRLGKRVEDLYKVHFNSM